MILGTPISMNDKNVVAIENRLKNHLFLTWVLNNICTNHCSYCPKEIHSGKNHNYEWEIARKFILNCFEKYGNIHCSVSGGEPTVSPFFKDLVNLIYDNGGTMHLTTNLVKPINYWKDIRFKFSSIAASYHPEFMPSERAEDMFIEKANFIGQSTSMCVRIMMLPNMWDKCYNFYKKASRENKGYAIELVRILPNFGVGEDYCDITYTDEQNDILNSYVFEAMYPKHTDLRKYMSQSFLKYDDNSTPERMDQGKEVYLENTKKANFLNWSCDIGLESLFVHFNGNVQRGNCGVGGFIGNINDFENISWPKESITCDKSLCHCVADLLMSKRIKD